MLRESYFSHSNITAQRNLYTSLFILLQRYFSWGSKNASHKFFLYSCIFWFILKRKDVIKGLILVLINTHSQSFSITNSQSTTTGCLIAKIIKWIGSEGKKGIEKVMFYNQFAIYTNVRSCIYIHFLAKSFWNNKLNRFGIFH